jgi:hypothetical protein
MYQLADALGVVAVPDHFQRTADAVEKIGVFVEAVTGEDAVSGGGEALTLALRRFPPTGRKMPFHPWLAGRHSSLLHLSRRQARRDATTASPFAGASGNYRQHSRARQKCFLGGASQVNAVGKT